MSYADWRRRDLRHIWHPYTDPSALERTAFPIIERAEGCRLVDVEGRTYLDGSSSWWCVNLGHSHPRLVRAIQDQAARLQHSLLGGASHPRAIELAERLASIAPAGLGHSMFAADGSCAVEAALKMALQYRVHRGQPKRTRFLAPTDAYHGDSLGAVGVGYIEAFHRAFQPVLQPALRALSPHCNRCPCGRVPETCGVECFASMETLAREHADTLTAIIIEPLCQAAAGMRIYPPAYLRRLRALCDELDLLLIADEVAVGFGRTGAMFACGKAGIRPDLLTLGKGLTGGMLPMSATLVTDEVFDAFRARDGQPRTFFHGHTFCGNPITSAVALAALEVYAGEHIVERVPAAAAVLRPGMQALAAALDDSPLRTLGLIAAVELKESAGGAGRARRITEKARELGLMVRPLGNTVYLWPPLNTADADLRMMTDILCRAAQETAADTGVPAPAADPSV